MSVEPRNDGGVASDEARAATASRPSPAVLGQAGIANAGAGRTFEGNRPETAQSVGVEGGRTQNGNHLLGGLTYRLRDTLDPEERLEDAAMFKALYDASGGKVKAIKEGEATFGAEGSMFKHTVDLRYWDDPAFLSNCGRSFEVCLFDKVEEAVARLHDSGRDAFIKSAFSKYFTVTIRRGEDVREAIGDMAYSFIDSPAPLMVQELVDFTFEHRFFCVDRQIVSWSPAAYTLTPLDFPTQDGLGWRKQADMQPERFIEAEQMKRLAWSIAAVMVEPSATIDIGMIGERPAVVEFNPFRAGMVGLFASDVRAIAGAAIAQAMCARQGQDPQGLGATPASAVRQDAPDTMGSALKATPPQGDET